MVTLQENAVKFNNNLIVSHDGGRLSSDSGLVLIDELMDAFQFTQLSEDIVTFNDSRKYWTHTNHKILKQLILQIIGGYNTDSAANILQHDPVLQTLLTDEPLASQSSISRLYDRVEGETDYSALSVPPISISNPPGQPLNSRNNQTKSAHRVHLSMDQVRFSCLFYV